MASKQCPSCTTSIKHHNNESRKCTNTGSRNRVQCGYDNMYTLSLRVFMCNHKSVIKPLIQTANLLKYKSHKLSDLIPMNGLCFNIMSQKISACCFSGGIFTIFANWTQFVNNFPLKILLFTA